MCVPSTYTVINRAIKNGDPPCWRNVENANLPDMGKYRRNDPPGSFVARIRVGMREPSRPESPNFEETGPIRVATRAPDPSYPDRARIDSDVRYLLRPPSTPWITFDKDPIAGEVFSSSRSSVIDAPGLFPDAQAAIAAATAREPMPMDPIPPVEPSNVVVATDIQPKESLHDITHDEPYVPPVATPKQIMVAVGAMIGVAATIVVAVFVLGSKSDAKVATAATAQPASIPTASEIAPPVLDAPSAPAPPPPTTAAPAKAENPGWAKLTIKGAAKGHRVYLDGKMLLGQGQRTFMIRCGDHTIAVGNKTDAKDVDVPCNGEYVVSH
jgi:hypothetical protein